jgi:hypothetical protein
LAPSKRVVPGHSERAFASGYGVDNRCSPSAAEPITASRPPPGAGGPPRWVGNPEEGYGDRAARPGVGAPRQVGVEGVGASNLVSATFVAHGALQHANSYSDCWEAGPGGGRQVLSPTGVARLLGARAPQALSELVQGPSWGAESPSARQGAPAGRDHRPGRGPKLCPRCGLVVDREDRGALRMPDGWWHRQCWIATAPEREEVLRSMRADVGRHRALAEYLLAQDEWGGLPAVVVGANLVGRSIGADNRC